MQLDFQNQTVLRSQIEKLKPTPGTCIFVDICGSTDIKQKEPKNWIVLIGNTIVSIRGTHQLFRGNVVKIIGDEIMIYIPDYQLNKFRETYSSLLGLFKGLLPSGNTKSDNLILPTKSAIHYCDDVYHFTFDSRVPDYYGNGIDFTARLMKVVQEDKVVISEEYLQKIESEKTSFFKTKPELQQSEFKGFNKMKKYYVHSFD